MCSTSLGRTLPVPEKRTTGRRSSGQGRLQEILEPGGRRGLGGALDFVEYPVPVDGDLALHQERGELLGHADAQKSRLHSLWRELDIRQARNPQGGAQRAGRLIHADVLGAEDRLDDVAREVE